MNKICKLILSICIAVSVCPDIFGQRLIKIDTSDVDVLAIFHYSGDKNAFEDNYFGMVLLKSASELENLLPLSTCSYHFYTIDDTRNRTIEKIINDHYIANVSPCEYMQHWTFFEELTRQVWKDSTNTWRDIVPFLMSQSSLHNDENYSISESDCFTDPFWEDCFHCGAPPARSVDLIGGGHSLMDADFSQAGYYYQLHKVRMAYLLIDDVRDSILKLSYFNPISPIFPQKNYKIKSLDEPVKFMMGNACATHLHAFEKDGMSRVAAPYRYLAVNARPSTGMSLDENHITSSKHPEVDSALIRTFFTDSMVKWYFQLSKYDTIYIITNHFTENVTITHHEGDEKTIVFVSREMAPPTFVSGRKLNLVLEILGFGWEGHNKVQLSIGRNTENRATIRAVKKRGRWQVYGGSIT